MARSRPSNKGDLLRTQIFALLNKGKASPELALNVLTQCQSHVRSRIIIQRTGKDCGVTLSGFRADIPRVVLRLEARPSCCRIHCQRMGGTRIQSGRDRRSAKMEDRRHERTCVCPSSILCHFRIHEKSAAGTPVRLWAFRTLRLFGSSLLMISAARIALNCRTSASGKLQSR